MKVLTILSIFILLGGVIALCVYLATRESHSGSQPDSSVKITNLTTEDPFYVFLPYSNDALNPPPVGWTKLSGTGDIGTPTVFGKGGQPATDVGAGTWQILTMNQGDTITMKIPDFTKGQAWTIRPLKKINGKFCTGGTGDCGMPTLIEAGKDMVGDMSAVDGVNFLLDYTLSSKGAWGKPGKVASDVRINFSTNPCTAIGAPSTKGCHNPAVDGQFKPGTTWKSPPCPAGVCNLVGKSKTWCDAIHTGQQPPWTYCYSHDDAGSSPSFDAPYIMSLTYRDLK